MENVLLARNVSDKKNCILSCALHAQQNMTYYNNILKKYTTGIGEDQVMTVIVPCIYFSF